MDVGAVVVAGHVYARRSPRCCYVVNHSYSRCPHVVRWPVDVGAVDLLVVKTVTRLDSGPLRILFVGYVVGRLIYARCRTAIYDLRYPGC